MTVNTAHNSIENTFNLDDVSFASSILLAPSNCPMMIPVALPKAIKETLATFDIVLDIFIAATTSRPLIE